MRIERYLLDVFIGASQVPSAADRAVSGRSVGDAGVGCDGFKSIRPRYGRARCPQRAATTKKRRPVWHRLRCAEDVAPYHPVRIATGNNIDTIRAALHEFDVIGACHIVDIIRPAVLRATEHRQLDDNKQDGNLVHPSKTAKLIKGDPDRVRILEERTHQDRPHQADRKEPQEH